MRAADGRDRRRDPAQRGAQADVDRARGASARSPASRPSGSCCRCSARALTPRGPRRGARRRAEIMSVKAGEAIIKEGEDEYDIFVIRQGSMVVEKDDRRQAGLPLLPSGRLLCRRDGADRRRPPHRDGARGDQVRGDQARRRRLPPRCSSASPSCSTAASARHGRRGTSSTAFIEDRKDGFGGVDRHLFATSPASSSTTASARRPTCC